MATKKFGYWVDLSAFAFSEEDGGSWIQAFPEGKYSHPVYGDMDFNAERLTRFADSVAAKVRGVELDIDYEHKAFTGEAAGWVKAAEYVPGQGLRIKVDWTAKAREAIKNKEYRYFSPEFGSEWEHPKTGVTHQDVLFGGALTNRPFLKDILPVNLSDLITEGVPTPKKTPEPGGLMDPKALRKALGLAEDATDEQVNAKLSELAALQTLLGAKPPTPPAPAPTPPAPKLGDPAPDDIAGLIAKLQETGSSPAVDALVTLMETQRTEIITLRKQDRERQVDVMLDELDRGKNFLVPPAVKQQLRAVMLGSTGELAQKLYDTYKATLELGVVDLNEQGWQRQGENMTASEALNAEVVKLMEADKNLSYALAYRQVSSMRPDLAQAVRKDSYIKDGV